MSEAEGRHGQASPQAGAPIGRSGAVVQHDLNGTWVIVAHGEYDLNNLGPLTEAVETAAAKQQRIALDVSGVTFADSTFLNLLLRINRLTSLRLVAPAPQFQRVLEITGADAVLDIRASIEDATTA
ncbi:STAS domain-containing protein [Streptomyces griseorubiginosus]|uniref:STAS domain-containing protein n=1 Tax=Streptomyces griseorubiginosus TaxID=67304 RepID=UPI0033AE788B